MPGNVALVITHRSSLATKSGRGRTYVGGWAETVNGANGSATAAAQTAALGWITAVANALTTNFGGFAVITRPQPDVVITKTITDGGITETQILSHQTAKPGQVHVITLSESRNLSWESQRRRINSRGLPPATLLEGVSVAFPTP
jgi:hypothetical protein